MGLLALISAGIMSGGTDTKDSVRKKAKHFFLTGAIKDAEGKDDEAYEYFKRAYEIDPSYIDAGNAYGSSRLFLRTDTLMTREERLKSLSLARPLTDAYPADQFSVIFYGYMSQMADTIQEAIRVYEEFSKRNPSNVSVILHKADVYGQAGQIDSAISAIKHYERIEGTSFESTLQKVRYHLLNEDTLAIINEMTELVASNPRNIDYLLGKGKVFGLLNMPDSALYYIKMAESIAPGDGKVKNELAQIYAQQGDSIEYDRLTYEALMSENLEMEVKVNILGQYLQRIFSDKSDTKRSDKLFNTLSEQYPHEPIILELGAQYSAAKQDYGKAIEQIKYAIDLDGQNPEYVRMLMTYYLIDEKPAEVVKLYEKGLNSEMPASVKLLYAAATERLGQYDKTIETYDNLLKSIAPTLSITDTVVDLNKLRDLDFQGIYLVASYYQMAGDTYYNAHKLPETFKSYENSLSILPDNPLALNNYAYFLIEKKDTPVDSEEFKKAKEMSKRALELTSDSPVSTYLDTYAWILFKEEEYQEAEDYQEAAMKTLEEEGGEATYDFYSHYGDILFHNGKPEEALEQWKKALEMEPDDKLLQKKVKNKTFFNE